MEWCEKMNSREIKKDFSRLGLIMLIAAIGISVLQVAGQMIAAAIMPEWIENYDIMLASSMLPLFVIGYPLLILVLRKGSGKAMEQHAMSLKEILLAFVMCYGLLVIGNLLGTVLTLLIGTAKGGTVVNPLMQVVTGGNLWITALYTVIAAPIYEEVIFRKLICGRLLKYGQGIAIVISALIFGLFHGNLNQFFYAFLMGLFFAYVYAKTGSIRNTIILHMMVNALGSVISVALVQHMDVETTAGQIGVGIYSICVYVIAIAGIIMLIRKRKTLLSLEDGEIAIEKKQRVRLIFGNAGMILYCAFWILVMLVQAFVM